MVLGKTILTEAPRGCVDHFPATAEQLNALQRYQKAQGIAYGYKVSLQQHPRHCPETEVCSPAASWISWLAAFPIVAQAISAMGAVPGSPLKMDRRDARPDECQSQ
jgi:hypothetical protein